MQTPNLLFWTFYFHKSDIHFYSQNLRNNTKDRGLCMFNLVSTAMLLLPLMNKTYIWKKLSFQKKMYELSKHLQYPHYF